MPKIAFKKNITFWSSLGAGFEYYDFVVFAYLAPFLSQVFFTGSESSTLINTYMIYAVGYFARPLGSFVYGAVGDVKGRYKTFLNIMYTMAFSTLGIAFLPSYEAIGIAAPLLLFCLRFIQGLSFGAELPGAIIVVSEHLDQKKQGRDCGFVISSVTLGSILASAGVLLITKFYSSEEIISWVWRVPFLVGGLLGLINLVIRKNLQETQAFLSIQDKQAHKSLWEPLKEVFRDQKKILFSGILLSLILSTLITTNIYFPVFLSKFYGFEKADIYLCMTLALGWCALLTPLLGQLGDRVGRHNLFYSTGFWFLIFFPLSLSCLKEGFWGLLFFCLLFQTFIAGFVSSYFPILVATFKTSVRFTSIALCYNITYALVSLLPVLFSSLLDSDPCFLTWILIGVAVLSLTGNWMLSRGKN
jgi:MFS family permease